MEQSKSLGRSTSENIHLNPEEQEILQGKSDASDSPTQLQDDSTRDDEEAKDDFWTITREFIYRHHVEPRVKLYVPRKIVPFPGEVHRRCQKDTYIIVCIVGENIEDYCNVDGEKELSDAWTGFTRFILLSERPPDGYTWSGRGLRGNKQPLVQTMYGHFLWKHMSDAATKKAKQGWAFEKPKLDIARQLRGTFFIEPNDEEFKLTMKAASRKLEVPMPAARPCKIPIKSSG